MLIEIGFLVPAVALLVLGGLCVLAANTTIPKFTSMEKRETDVEEAKHIYNGAGVGRHVATGYLRPFVVCDVFSGFAAEECDNSSGSSGDKSCKYYTTGDFVLALTGVTIDDVGRAVFATADDAFAFVGHSLAFVGRVVGVDQANKAIVRLRAARELPDRADQSPYCLGGPWTKATGADGGATEHLDGDGMIVASTLGLGVIPAADERLQLSLDNTSEVSNATVKTPAKFDLDKGIVAQFKVAAYSSSGVAMTGTVVDLDFGLADAVVVTAVDPTRHVRLHVDAGATNVLLGADDDSEDVAEADTGLEIPITAALAELYTIIVREDGTVEVYNGATLITTPSLAEIDMSSGGNVCGFVNVEKTAAAGIAIIEILEAAIYGGS